MTRILL